jgi:hypothetical protein
MRRTLQAKLLILAIFIIGVLTGAVLMDVYETRVFSRNESRSGRSGNIRETRSFQEFLELTEEQQSQVDLVLEATRESFRTLREQTRPLYDDLREDSRGQIRAILTEEQLVRFDEWIEREGQRERRGRGDR